VSLGERLERSQLPRRLLGAVLAVLVPGAGHVVIGYFRLGWIVAALTLLVGACFIASVLGCVMIGVGVSGAVFILGTTASAISVFALPPGPRLKDGLRALWPVLVLFLVFRGAADGVQRWAIAVDLAADDGLRPAIVRGDTVFSNLSRRAPTPGDVVVIEPEPGQRYLRRVVAVADDRLWVTADPPDPLPYGLGPVLLTSLRGRALFVFAAARGTNGVDRVWRPLGHR
jgi:hypothetical protein